MSDDKRQDRGHDWCPPPTKNRAPQPNPPGDGKTCEPLPTSTHPPVPEPKPCPEPDSCCKCPAGPKSTPNCLEDLIAGQTASIAAGKKAEEFKTELAQLLAKAKAANQDYTRAKYDALVKEWVKQDGQIVEKIRELVCAVPCWQCVIECHICPLLNEMRNAEKRLYGDNTLYADVHNEADLLYWLTRDKEAKERRFNRIKTVLAAWEKPAQTIEKALADDAKIIAGLGTDRSKDVYDIFLRLVPMHLAIAPPDVASWPTNIDIKYTQFCSCDTPDPDSCCGPDLGLWGWSLRQRLIGPQPYLIDPNDYFEVICCLVKARYGPAQAAYSEAEAAVVTQENEIKRLKGLVDDGLKNFEKTARGAIPGTIDCCKYECDDSEPTPTQAR